MDNVDLTILGKRVETITGMVDGLRLRMEVLNSHVDGLERGFAALLILVRDFKADADARFDRLETLLRPEGK